MYFEAYSFYFREMIHSLTLIIGIGCMCVTHPLSITEDVSVHPAGSSHVPQRQFITSVIRNGENSGGAVVSVANVTTDVVEDDPVSGCDCYSV